MEQVWGYRALTPSVCVHVSPPTHPQILVNSHHDMVIPLICPTGHRAEGQDRHHCARRVITRKRLIVVLFVLRVGAM